MAIKMTMDQAVHLARQDDSGDYIARKLGGKNFGYWVVWCVPSDHAVEYDQSTIDAIPANASGER